MKIGPRYRCRRFCDERNYPRTTRAPFQCNQQEEHNAFVNFSRKLALWWIHRDHGQFPLVSARGLTSPLASLSAALPEPSTLLVAPPSTRNRNTTAATQIVKSHHRR